MTDLVLGIDVGTSGLKSVLLDGYGRVVDEASATYDVHVPQAGWTEQDPVDWWTALRSTLDSLWQRGNSAQDIVGIGLTGQMHTLVLVDEEGAILAPAILWSDQRTAAECRDIEDRVGVSELISLTGNRALPGFTAPKLLWVRQHWPDVYRRTRCALLPKDFVRFRLSGAQVTDMSDASGTLLFDVRRRSWSDEMLHSLAIPPRLLPLAVEGTTRTGAVTELASLETGLKVGTPIIAGGSDNAAAAVGLNVVDPGLLTLSMGTSGVLFAPLNRYPDNVDGRLHVFCHAIPDRWHLMAVTLSAGGSLHWLSDLLQPVLPSGGDAAYAWLVERAGAAPTGSDGLIFLPYLTGERTPHADPNARGVFYGLNLGHRLEHLVRSVLEGVAFSQREGLDLMRQAGATAALARGAGGGLNSPLWRHILADTLRLRIQTTASATGAARGAAVLAGLGVGLFATPDVGVAWADQDVVHPDDDVRRQAVLERSFGVYRAVYANLAGLFAASA